MDLAASFKEMNEKGKITMHQLLGIYRSKHEVLHAFLAATVDVEEHVPEPSARELRTMRRTAKATSTAGQEERPATSVPAPIGVPTRRSARLAPRAQSPAPLADERKEATAEDAVSGWMNR